MEHQGSEHMPKITWGLTVLIALLISVVSVTFIIGLRQRAINGQNKQIELTDLQEKTSSLNALQWESTVVFGDDKLRNRYLKIHDDLLKIKHKLEEQEEAKDTLKTVLTSFDQYLAVVDKEYQLISAGATLGSQISAQRPSEILYQELNRHIDATKKELADESARLNTTATVGSLLVSLSAGLIIIVLFRRYEVIREFTQRAKMEQQALSKSEELYRGMTIKAPVAIFIQCAGKCVFANDAGLRLMGATVAGQLLGKKILDNYPELPNHDDPLSRREEVVRVEKQISRLDGQLIDVEMVITPYTYHHRPAIQIAAYDITERKRASKKLEKDLEEQREKKDRMFKVYRDVIYAVTQGKFRLLHQAEVGQVVNEGLLVRELDLSAPEDVSHGRQLVKECIKEHNYPSQRAMHIALCVSETATNVIKHAGEGFMHVRRIPGKVRIIIQDRGPGMEFDKLPNMIFMKGFSTKISLGCGFSIIAKYADKVFLDTSESGTFLALDFYEAHYQAEMDAAEILG